MRPSHRLLLDRALGFHAPEIAYSHLWSFSV